MQRWLATKNRTWSLPGASKMSATTIGPCSGSGARCDFPIWDLICSRSLVAWMRRV